MPIESAKELLAEVRRVRDEVAAQSAEIREGWEPKLHRDAFRPSYENLADYLAFRRIDLRPVDAALAPWGLASLGRCESRVMPSLRAIIANLELICRTNAETPRPDPADFQRGLETLKRNTQAVLGPGSEGRRTRILVTLSPQAAEDKAHVRELVDAGMDCARINCAHETPSE